MRIRLSAPWAALVVVLVAAFAYSVGAQQVVFTTGLPPEDRLVVKAVPEGRDIRSFASDVVTTAPVDLYTTPAGRVFVVTDIAFGHQPSVSTNGPTVRVRLRENGPAGLLRGEFAVAHLTSGGSVGAMSYSLSGGIPYPPGSTVTVEATCNCGGGAVVQPVTISGYLADA